jgi:hypothetical protein
VAFSTPDRPKSAENPGFVERKVNNRLYPLDVRWEVTRRHPYYLVFWRQALLYRQNQLGDHPAERLLRYAATLMLGSIGVFGEPVSPETPFPALMEGCNEPGFLSGSVQPISFRAAIAMLINGLPPAERAVVGAILMTGGDDEIVIPGDDDDRTQQKQRALASLGSLISPTLDSYPDIPLFYVHVGASQRGIARDIEDQVRRWKRRRGLASNKVHTSKLSKYLEVWDLREGWNGGGYNRSKELTFVDVGRRLKICAISTVVNRYRSAFEMITGYTFKPDLWWRLFGPLKFSALCVDPSQTLSAPIQHRLKSPIGRPIPETRVSPTAHSPHLSGTVESGSAIGDDAEQRDLLIDLRDLIGRGLNDQEIARRLEIDDPLVVAYFRTRNDDFNSI